MSRTIFSLASFS